MNNNNLFAVVLNAIKARFVSVVARLRMWTNLNFIRTRIFGRIRTFFANLFNVKPRHKNDYYGFFDWLISKRLAFAIVVVIGSLSLVYLFYIRSTVSVGPSGAGIKTYAYNAIPLRFAKGTVRITGRGGYLAYEGSVREGGVNGNGTLYDREGNKVYTGEFVKNEFSGRGTGFYANGGRRYVGEYLHNLYEGTGKLFRDNGTALYDGEFSLGLKEGMGKLYDTSAKLVYTGQFSSDNIQYSSFLGKNPQEAMEMYTGDRVIYQDMADNKSMIVMPAIDAMYTGGGVENALDDEIKIDSIYVMSGSFAMGGTVCNTIEQVSRLLGRPSYEGNSAVTTQEAVVINFMNSRTDENVMHGEVSVRESGRYVDYREISSVDTSYQVYLYSFESEGLVYTFICRDTDGNFSFYFIENAES